MYRLLAFIIAVGVLGGALFFGGFLTPDKVAEKRTDNVAALIADAEQAVPSKTEEAAIEADGQIALALPQLAKPLTAEDVTNAAAKAGLDAEQTALRVGQNPEQAAKARQIAQESVRVHMGRRLRAEQAAIKSQ